MINFSIKAAKRFRVKWADLQDRSGDFWKVDVMMVDRVPVLFIIHEYTLFTLVRRKSQFKNPGEIVDEIMSFCPWYKKPDTVTFGKNNNLKLTGSLTEMKRLTKGLYSPDEINRIEWSINKCIYTYLSPEPYHYGNPFEAVESYVKGETPWLK